MTLPAFDFLDDDWFATNETHDVWRELRQHEPVYWHQRGDAPGFWLLTKHSDVMRVARENDTFICERGTGPASPKDTAAPPDQRLPSEQTDRMLNLIDPPDHTLMRKIVSYAFTPRTVARIQPLVESEGARVLDELGRKKHGDFVADVATRVPIAVLSALLGLPQEDWQRLSTWTADMAGEDPPGTKRSPEERHMAARVARAELIRYLRELVTARREEPREDLISELLAVEEQGKLSDPELMWFCFLLVNAGHDTTRNALAGGVHALLERPEERQRLLNDPNLVETAVEETARFTSPIVYFGRFVTKDTELRGRAIRAGQRVLMLYPSANRDEEVFPDPDRFDVGRTPNDHVAFGAGRHFCLGAALARLQLRVLLPLTFARLPELALDGEPRWIASNFSTGLARLPVRVGTA